MAFDRTDSADVTAALSEMQSDPAGVGLAPLIAAGDASPTQPILDKWNEKTATTVVKPKISSAAVRSATTFDAYNALSIDEQEWIRWMTGSNGFEEENLVVTDDLRQKLSGLPNANEAIWAAADRSAMNAAMSALTDVLGSRAEILFGFGTIITRDDWFVMREQL